eukprot:scaffold25533_cov60-Phaeocystis_antarctica.AAC.6
MRIASSTAPCALAAALVAISAVRTLAHSNVCAAALAATGDHHPRTGKIVPTRCGVRTDQPPLGPLCLTAAPVRFHGEFDFPHRSKA